MIGEAGRIRILCREKGHLKKQRLLSEKAGFDKRKKLV